MNCLAAFILAGGRSKRMGRDKAFMVFQGKTLLERAISIVHSAVEEVSIVGDANKFTSYGRVVEDIFPGRGPLGGIHAALTHTTADLNLMLAVDLPFVEEKLVTYLATAASQGDALVTVPHTEDGWQPLCAIYRRQFVDVAEMALRKGNNKVDALFAEVKIREISVIELASAGFSTKIFCNLNTPEDLEQAGKSHL